MSDLEHLPLRRDHVEDFADVFTDKAQFATTRGATGARIELITLQNSLRIDRDRGTPRGAAPPTPPGIRITYHGGSIGLSLGRDMEARETERLEVMVAQGLLDRRVS